MQLMILLYALLAPLTGQVSEERRVERAQMELRAVAAVVVAASVAARASLRPENRDPRFERHASRAAPLVQQAPVRSGRTLLCLKQSWLH